MVRVGLVTESGETVLAEQGMKGYEVTGAKVSNAINSVSGASLTFPATNRHVLALRNMNPVVTVYDNETRRFIGQVAGSKHDLYGNLSVSLDGPLSWLGNIVKAPFTVPASLNMDAETYLTRIITQYNEAVSSIRQVAVGGVTVNAIIDVKHSDEYVNTLDLIREILELYGGYVFENYGAPGILPFVSYVAEPTVTTPQVLEFGVNVKSLEDVLDFSGYASRVYGVGKDGITANAVATTMERAYGRRDYTLKSQAETVEELQAEVQAELAKHTTPIRSIELTAVELSKMNHTYKAFQVGTIATALDRRLGLDIPMMVNSTEHDLISRSQSKVVFGKAPANLVNILVRGGR